MHPPDAGIRAASRSQRLEAAQQLLKWSSLPSSRLLCPPLAAPCCALRQAVPKAGSSHACPITPLLRVNCAGSDAVATVLVCLWYQTSSAHDAYHHAPHLQIHCIASDAAAVAAPQGITIYLTQHSN